MAILLLNGTCLETQTRKRPLNKLFLVLIGSLYLLFFHISAWLDNGQGIERYSNLVTWFIVLSLIFVGIVQVTREKILRYSKLTCGLFICCFLLTLPALESDANIIRILPKLSAVWLGWLLFLVLQQMPFINKHKQKLLWFIVLSSLIGATISYITIVPHTFRSDFFYKQQIWNEYSNYKSAAIFFITGLISSGYLLARQVKKYQLEFSPVILLYITPTFTLPLILQIYSPIIWTILLISLSALLRYVIRHSTTKRLVGWSLSMLIGSILGIVAFCFSLSFSNNNQLAPVDNSQFVNSVAQTTDMLIERPFTGYGYGRFTEEYVLYTARQHSLNSNFPPAIEGINSPHSEILSWAIEGGLIPFLAILLSALFVLFRGYFAKNGTRLATFSLLLPIVIGCLSSEIMYQTHLHWITLVILLYWLDQRVTRYREISLSQWKIRSINIIGMPLVLFLGIYLVTVGHNHFYYEQYHRTGIYNHLSQMIMPTVYKQKSIIAKINRQLAATTQDSSLEKYIPELLKIIKQEPTPAYYTLLILCYTKLGDENKALQTQLESQYLFPNSSY